MQPEQEAAALGEGAMAGRQWPRTVLALALALALAGALHLPGPILLSERLPYLLGLMAPGLLAWQWGCSRNPHPENLRSRRPLLLIAAVGVLFLFSSATLHPWFFFLGWGPAPGRPLQSGLEQFALWAALLTLVEVRPRGRAWLLPLLVLLWAEWACAHALWRGTGGAALYRTDHPSFMFRLWEFTRTFPQLMNYLPLWNGGVEHSTAVTTGVAGPGLVLWPLFRFWPVHEVYTLGWILLFIVIVPWVGVASVRAMGGDRAAACVGGILALGVSQHFFLWALHYGTIGASFAAAMTMPVCALGFRVVHQRRLGLRVAVACVAAGLLLLTWAPCGLVAIAVALAAVVGADRLSWRSTGFLVACGVSVLLLYSPWLRALLVSGRETVAFVTTTSATPHAGGADWSARWETLPAALVAGALHLKAHLHEVNPLILFFGGVAVLAGVQPRLRRWFGPILAILAAIAGWSEEFLPHSQLSRMAIPLAFAAALPAALFLGRLLRTRDRRLALVRATILAALIACGRSVAMIDGNGGRARYVTMGQDIDDLAAWLRAHTPPDARTLFAGSCVHGYGGGNVAYLPLLCGRELMAIDYYGFPPEQVRYEYPPRAFCESEATLQVFFDAYRVSHLVTYHENWKQRFRDHPDLYRECAAVAGATIFERRGRHPGLFLQNSGKVTAALNRIHVTLDDPHAPAVIAYNWLDGLQAPPPVAIHPHPVAEGLVLIRLEPGGCREFTITYTPGRRHPQDAEP